MCIIVAAVIQNSVLKLYVVEKCSRKPCFKKLLNWELTTVSMIFQKGMVKFWCVSDTAFIPSNVRCIEDRTIPQNEFIA